MGARPSMIPLPLFSLYTYVHIHTYIHTLNAAQPTRPCCGCWSPCATSAWPGTKATGLTSSATNAAFGSTTTWPSGTPRVRMIHRDGERIDWAWKLCTIHPFTFHITNTCTTHTGKMVSKVESEYAIGQAHPTYGDDFREENHIVQGEVSCWDGGNCCCNLEWDCWMIPWSCKLSIRYHNNNNITHDDA